jgi:hypothetical protein
LLTVDIEGSERNVLADCSSWVDSVSAITIQLHSDYSVADFARGLSTSSLVVLDPLEASGTLLGRVPSNRDAPPTAFTVCQIER